MTAEDSTGTHILSVEKVQRSFGGLCAVDVESLRVERGTITSLIGPNGAGKTTFFNLLSGFDRVDAGRWWFDGVSLTGKKAHVIARAGAVRTFQLTKTLAKMTVLENMVLAARSQTGERLLAAPWPPAWRRQERGNVERADKLIERFGLTRLRDEYAGTMSGGQRKLLELARAMMLEPTMLMLDEPMAGVNPALTESLLDQITSLRDEDGTTVLFIEHDMDVIQRISDTVVVMAEGQILTQGLPGDVAKDERVIEAYLGSRRGGVS